jgi:HEPN/Toprim N-terminal domain 1
MGSYAEFWLESLFIGSTKNAFDPNLMQLFRASDKRVHRCAVKELPQPRHHWASYMEPDEIVDAVYYTAPVPLVKDRLELKGYTLDTAKRAFAKRMRAQAKEYKHEARAGLEDYYENKAKLLKALDEDKWTATLRHIKEAGLDTPEWFGFEGINLNVPLRLALEIRTDQDNCVYDVTDLITQEYFDKSEDFVALASEPTLDERTSRSKIIILTEGKSDGRILSESMRLLYPHLADYFAFMDFEGARVEGGAPHLAKIVKAFAGAGIVNKTIAIFANDTAGQDAIRSLREIKLPGNLSVLRLPELKALCRYPTIGPSGLTNMNINGKAASIELYLGDDVLRGNGKLQPVKWSSYIASMGQYQGEILGKDKIHKRFREKLARQRNRPNLTQDPNWSGLCTIMSGIFSAFHRFDRELILREGLEKYQRS